MVDFLLYILGCLVGLVSYCLVAGYFQRREWKRKNLKNARAPLPTGYSR